MTTKASNTHRFAAADELLDALLGKRGDIAEQFVKTHHHEIAALLAAGMSASRVASLLAVPLSASPRRVFGALKNAGFVTGSDAPAVAQEPAEHVIVQPAPKRSEDDAVLAAVKAASADSPAPKPAKAAQAAAEPRRTARQLFDRIDQAAKLSHQLTGKPSARAVCDAFVTERIGDIKRVLQLGMSQERFARHVAPALGVRPSALKAAFKRAGLTSTRTTPRASKVAKTETTTTAPTAPAISTKPRVSDQPNWADGSDKRVDESGEDYRLNKEIEGPPSAGVKGIGESPAERG